MPVTMKIIYQATSISEAISVADHPVIGGISLDYPSISTGMSHQFNELCISTRQNKQQLYITFTHDSDQLDSECVALWNQSIYLCVVVHYSIIGQSLAQRAKRIGASLNLSGITALAQLHNSLEAGATGAWLPLQQLDHRLERSSEDLLSRSRVIIDQHEQQFDLVASEVSDVDQLAYALEYGADATVISPHLFQVLQGLD